MSGETVSGDVLRVEAGDEIPSLASYRVFGSLTENPESSWKNGDKLSVTVSFTFRPAEDAEPDEGEPTETDPEPEEAEPEQTEPEEPKADAKPEEQPENPPPEPDPGPEPSESSDQQ